MTQKNSTGTSLLYLATFLWGSAFIAQKWLLSLGFSPLYMNAFRFIFVFLLIYLIPRQSIKRHTFYHSMMLGMLLCIAYALQAYGLKYLDISVSAILIGTNLIFIPIFYSIIFKNEINPFNIISIILVIIGIFYFIYQPNPHTKSSFGILLTILSSIIFALHIFYTSYFIQKHENVLNLYIFQCIFTALFSFILALSFEPFPKHWTPKIFIALTYLGLIASILCYGLQFFGQKNIQNPSKARLILSLGPIWATLIAIPIFKESLSLYKIIGIGIIFLAIFISEWHNDIKKKISK